jgi:hypothetical protein
MPVFYSAVVAYGCPFDCREEVATECVSLSVNSTMADERKFKNLKFNLEKLGRTELGSKTWER